MRYYDKDFLQQLNKIRLRTVYARIILLTFDEEIIKEIQGEVVSGNISVNGSSAIRRTVSLGMIVKDNADITNLENEISINKKFRLEIGLKNPLKNYIDTYGEIVWFSQGTFVLSSVNSSRNTNGWTLNLTAKDKMCLLDGSAGGSFHAPTVLSDKYIYLSDGSVKIEYPVLRQIIYEAVNHYGGEDPNNIFINDLDDTVKMLVKYDGFQPIYYITTTVNNQKNGVYTFEKPSSQGYATIVTGEDVGYKLTDFTYPGELVLNPGETVVTLLDKIIDVLGNYEYFYDVDGHFIFQEIKNYVNKQSPLDVLSSGNLDNEDCLPNFPATYYTRIYNTNATLYSLTDLDAAAAITFTPKYDNIKNDFYVWGQRSENHPIHYHLAIDAKPIPSFALKNMYPVYNDKDELIDYVFEDNGNECIAPALSLNEYEWREELYRQALYAQTKAGFGYDNNIYYEELTGFWRDLYDPAKEEWNGYGHWNPDVYENPQNLDFWLDIIDTGAEIGKYAISQIGRRTKAVNNNEIKTIYNKEVPDILFVPANEKDRTDAEKQKMIDADQEICYLPDYKWDLFSISTTGASCFDEIRNQLYQHLNYNAQVQITCLPIYYLEPNNLIYIEDAKSGIIGNYKITQFSIPLTYNGTMSITAIEVSQRI